MKLNDRVGTCSVCSESSKWIHEQAPGCVDWISLTNNPICLHEKTITRCMHCLCVVKIDDGR
jgi:hypothetical protein